MTINIASYFYLHADKSVPGNFCQWLHLFWVVFNFLLNGQCKNTDLIFCIIQFQRDPRSNTTEVAPGFYQQGILMKSFVKFLLGHKKILRHAVILQWWFRYSVQRKMGSWGIEHQTDIKFCLSRRNWGPTYYQKCMINFALSGMIGSRKWIWFKEDDLYFIRD